VATHSRSFVIGRAVNAERTAVPDHRRSRTDFELVLWPGTPAKAELGSAVYTIEVDDCRAAFETLASRGVKFEPSGVTRVPVGLRREV
jgi:hypothetical protein